MITDFNILNLNLARDFNSFRYLGFGVQIDSAYAQLVLTGDPYLYYRLNDDGGNFANNLGTGNISATYVSDAPRNVRGPLSEEEENGTSVTRGYVSVPTSMLNATTEFSLEFWVYNGLAASTSVITEFLTYALSASQLVWTLTTTNGDQFITLSNLDLNEWYHVALTYDGTTMRFYLDGSEVVTAAHTGDVILPPQLKVGQGMSGKIAELAIYPSVLTAQNVLDRYLLALGEVEVLTISAPTTIGPEEVFNVIITARDNVGKRVRTDSTTEVTVSSNDVDLVFDADGDGTFGEV